MSGTSIIAHFFMSLKSQSECHHIASNLSTCSFNHHILEVFSNKGVYLTAPLLFGCNRAGSHRTWLIFMEKDKQLAGLREIASLITANSKITCMFEHLHIVTTKYFAVGSTAGIISYRSYLLHRC